MVFLLSVDYFGFGFRAIISYMKGSHMRLVSCILIESKKLKAHGDTEKDDNEEHSYGNSFKKRFTVI